MQPDGGIVPEKGKENSELSKNKTEAALMPRDSNWMFVCWEISEQQKKDLAERHGSNFMNSCRYTVRVHDITAGTVFDTEVLPDAKSWYLNVNDSGHEYFCEIGIKNIDTFEPLAKTNTVKLPPANITELIEEKIQSVSGNLEKLIEAGAGKAGAASENLAKRWEMLRSVFGTIPPAKTEEKKVSDKVNKSSDLWLVADCEVVVFGATDREAEVTIGGRKVYLNPDGTFTARFALPDGLTRFRVCAQSADKEQAKEITIDVDRKTDRK